MHAPLSDPGGVLKTCHLSPSGLLPSEPIHAVGFPSLNPREFILMTTTIHISGLYHTACILASSSFVLPLPGLHVDVTTGLLALSFLFHKLHFSLVGLPPTG